mgnify:CR=1 FL=1|tara:strand:+ start:7298 stop:8440 length:1143 start_codon:yes stop_codon:yes gene_type:complete
MKIIHLISSIDKGGAETHLYSLIKKQVEDNFEVSLIYLKGNDYWKKFYKKLGVKTYKLNYYSKFNLFNFFLTILKIKKIINTINPKIIHSHLSAMELAGALIKLFSKQKFKYIVTKHLDSFFLEASFGRKKFLNGSIIDKFIINRAEKVICISNQVRDHFQKIITDKNKLKKIYYGFNFNDYQFSKNYKLKIKLFKKKFKIKEKDFILCNIARHVHQKSLDVLIKVFSKYSKKNINSKLILIGKGPETQNLKKLSNELNIQKKLIWISEYENIRDIISISNVFILTSKYEGLGLVLLEAMAEKKPILASKISAIPEIVKNNYNGILVKHGDVKEFAKKIEIFENTKKSIKFGGNGFYFLKKNFNLDKMYGETKKIYLSKK